ncbi:hypothetical protein Patl1_35626 [Pistacia atlantica]|nr:hypothetical protein Patl1_35626 [Pistacia atlantica]
MLNNILAIALVHSGGGRKYGENLVGSRADLSGTDVVKMWVNEKANYDYKSNTCAAGKVRCNNGGTFIGCNYAPPGNYVGQKPY